MCAGCLPVTAFQQPEECCVLAPRPGRPRTLSTATAEFSRPSLLPQTQEAPDQGSGIKELEIPVRRDEQI